MENIKYIYVLDYSDCSICELKYDASDNDFDIEDYLEQHGCNVNTCSWMFSNAKIETIIELN